MSGHSARLIVAAACLLTVVACAPGESPAPEAEEMPEAAAVEEAPVLMATAVLQPRAGGSASGTVTFSQVGGEVRVTAEVVGVPAGPHGFHVHEIGDCSAEDFTSAGGHFNPGEAPHGAPADGVRHAGDLGNFEVGEDGTGRMEISSELLTVADGPFSVVGRGVILHEQADDLVSQPTGAAGGRIACGVVELQQPM